MVQSQYGTTLLWAGRTPHRTGSCPQQAGHAWSPWSCRHRQCRGRRGQSPGSAGTPWHTCPWWGWRPARSTQPRTSPGSPTGLMSWADLGVKWSHCVFREEVDMYLSQCPFQIYREENTLPSSSNRSCSDHHWPPACTDHLCKAQSPQWPSCWNTEDVWNKNCSLFFLIFSQIYNLGLAEARPGSRRCRLSPMVTSRMLWLWGAPAWNSDPISTQLASLVTVKPTVVRAANRSSDCW